MITKKQIKKLLPAIILNLIIKILKKIRLRKFYLLEKLDSDTKNLISQENIKLENIMNNQEIINSWNEWCNKLSSFKISDVKAGVNVGDQKAIFFNKIF